MQIGLLRSIEYANDTHQIENDPTYVRLTCPMHGLPSPGFRLRHFLLLYPRRHAYSTAGYRNEIYSKYADRERSICSDKIHGERRYNHAKRIQSLTHTLMRKLPDSSSKPEDNRCRK